MGINKNSIIYVAGHSGMVGSAIVRRLKKDGYGNLLLRSHKQLDLMEQSSVLKFFKNEKPEIVFIAAARVGGIQANDTYRGQFLYENLMIQNNTIHSAHEVGVQKLLFLGSACIYPRDSIQPIKEEYLLSYYLEPTNEPYAIAKIAGIKLCESYYRQYGDNFISAMPNNLYGPNDNFDLETSHVFPALIRKIHEAKVNRIESVELWGTGKPKREFLHVDDLADSCLFLMNNLSADQLYRQNISHINIGSGEEITIKELALMVKDIVGYKGEIQFNSDYPDGMPRKLLDVSRITSMSWKSLIDLDTGIKAVYEWYQNNLQFD